MLPSLNLSIAGLLVWLVLVPQVIADSDYPAQVKAILERRCMVCHGCYDAPCQLKLDAWQGLQRGASKDKVYDGARLLTANMTRLFEDAQTPEDWREKGFYPVLDEQRPEHSVFSRMLGLKRQHPLPRVDQLPDSFDFGLDRYQQCPKPEEFDRFARDYPLWGMPYGFPGLAMDEQKQVTDWLAQGAPGAPRPDPGDAERAAVARWEAFFNGPGLKQKLASRYIYEHLFIGNLHFPDIEESTSYYTLVRSHTPPGQAIDVIATRRPYDSPGTDEFFYRLQPLRTAVIDKRHMPYALNRARMARWQSLFLEADYEVNSLPGYEPAVASNPFVAFRELPVASRYQFMLDEAQFTIMAYIKGPVCRGQVALNVIDDHFWVVFSDPNLIDPDQDAEFLARESDKMRLPGDESRLIVSLVEWRNYARSQRKYLKAKSREIDRLVSTGRLSINLDMIWDGDGHNDNAALTIFRHKDSASVVKGLVGQVPKTAWVIGYSLLERIYYLLVAGFDVYGNVAHQLDTRRYMDFLRMEGEHNFLIFMPEQKRYELRNFWYREAGPEVKDYVLGPKAYIDEESEVAYETDDPMSEFFAQLRPLLPGSTAARYQPVDAHFDKMQGLTGRGFRLMPEVAYVHVINSGRENSVYTILHNSAYLNSAHLFGEERRRLPVEDYLTVVKGFIGSYPNVFFQVHEDDLDRFVAAIETMQREADYAKLVSDYGVRRTSPRFWEFSDMLLDYYHKDQPIEAGLFDLNRYENR